MSRLYISLTARRSNQSILKEISPGCSLEGLMLKLKLQYFGHLMGRADSFEKTLMLGKIEGRRRRGWQRMRWLDGITDSTDMVWVDSRCWWWTWRPGVLQFMGSQRVEHDWATELNWVFEDSQPVHSEGDQPWDFFGRNDAKAEAPVLWPPHVKSWLIGKDPDAGKDWRQEEKGMIEDEIVGWHHWLNGHEFE